MSATRRQVNWSGISFLPNGSSTPIPIAGVTNCTIAPAANLLKFSGDNDRYPTTTVLDFSDPTVTVTTADLITARSLVPGTRGILTAIHLDARNGVGSGAMTYTIIAIVQDNGTGGAHRQFGQATITFHSESVDGQTSPIGVVVAA